LNGTYILPNSSLADNLLDSSSITALYGALMGMGIGWSPTAHHVVVWIGSTVPRDPNYVVNYCQSFSKEVPKNITSATDPRCYSPSCEPAYNFGGGVVSPNCEGWVTSQDGNASDSIAALAYSSPACVDSLGGSCTIDALQTDWGGDFNWSLEYVPDGFGTLDVVNNGGSAYSGCFYWATPQHGNCTSVGVASAHQIFQSTNRTLAAGCDLSSATGGSWDGPFVWEDDWELQMPRDTAPFYWPTTCGGKNGTFQPPVSPFVTEPYYWGSYPYDFYYWGACYNSTAAQKATPPNMCDTGPMRFGTSAPWLISSLGNISLGQPTSRVSLAGIAGEPLYRFVPWSAFALASFLDYSQSCSRAGGYPVECASSAQPTVVAGVPSLALNWSANADLNLLEPGDSWTASFNVVATGPPFQEPVPVDACTTSPCLAAGSGSVGGFFTSIRYVTPTDGNATVLSFPLVTVTVEPLPASSSTPTSSGPPPPPPIGAAPPVPAPVPTPTPITLPQPVGAVIISVAGFSVPAVAAGILAAGATRVALQRRVNKVAVVNRVSTGLQSNPEGGR
jgi:hypothetical protein